MTDFCGFDCFDDVSADLKLFWRGEDLFDVVVVEQELREGAHGASAGKVANEHHGAVAESSAAFEAALEGVDVEQGLRGVLVFAGACVDDWDGAFGVGECERHLFGESFLLRAHDDEVEVGGECADGVFLRFAFEF